MQGSNFAANGQKFAHVFKPLIISGFHELQQEIDYKRGVYYVDVYKAKNPEFEELVKKGCPKLLADTSMYQMVINDEIYFDKEFVYFSMVPLEGYRKFSDLFNKEFKGYEFSADRVISRTTAPLQNYEHLRSVLLEKNFDSDEVKSFEYLVQNNYPMYLDQSCHVPQIAFGSLMRSGNTFFRRFFENITGTVTGSNIEVLSSVVLSFIVQGFKGEGVVDNRTWVVKTHYPYIYLTTFPCNLSRAIVLVRNPFDVLVSLFQFSLTGTHSRGVTNFFPTEFKTEWEQFIKFGSRVWIQFYKTYIDWAQKREVPVYFLRYEDLATDAMPNLEKTFEFILGVESIEGLYIQKRIQDVLQRKDAGHVYQQRTGKINLNSHGKFFSEAQKNYILKTCKQYLNFFGYTEIEGQENKFGFFKYDSMTEEEIKDAGKFRELNREMLQWYISDREAIDQKSLEVNKPNQGIQIKFQEEPFIKYQKLRPALNMEHR